MKYVKLTAVTMVVCWLSLSCASGASQRRSVDYAQSKNWASLPSVQNNSMRVPVADMQNNQSTAKADVFYIYPTIYTSFLSNNASISDEGYRDDVANLLLTSQASSLNNVGKIYTPYYRQASLWVYLDTEQAKKEAFDIAYADVDAAFQYYMEHYNQGRPLFILAHSQGSQIAVRLLQENYQKLHLEQILVAAYIIGERIGTRTFVDLPPCTTDTQINCFVTWGAVVRGGKSDLMTGDIQGNPVCVNPLNWRMDEQVVHNEHHLGGVPDTFDSVLPHLISTQCKFGLLNIEPAPAGFAHDGKDYHESDINLFYMDIRHNAKVRLQQFQRWQ